MSFEELRIAPGFDVETTTSLNSAGINDGAFIRWKDGFAEKLGGWAKFYPFSIGSIPRVLWPWQDLNQRINLGIGATGGLFVLTSGVLTNISPQTTTTSAVPNFSTTSGSPLVTITDPNFTPSINDWVFLREQVSAGGLLLFGIYQITAVLGANVFQITAPQNAPSTAAQLSPPAAPALSSVGGGALGATTYFVKVTYVNASGETLVSAESSLAVAANNLLKVTSPAASGSATSYNVYVWTVSAFEVLQTTTPIALGTDWTEPVSGLIALTFGGTPTVNSTGGSLPLFEILTGTSTVNVILKNHGLVAGQTAFFLDSTGLGGVTVLGNYQVQSPVTANAYSITTTTQATSNALSFQNAGNLNLVYYIVIGPQVAAGGWGVGTWGSGTWGIGTAPATGTGTPITASDWSMFNFGEDLIANPAGGPIYEWGPESGFQNAGIIGQGPIIADGCFLTQPQQIIVAWGASFNDTVNPMRLVWCDAGNFLSWTPTSTNFAGGFTISRGSKIVACVQGANQFTVHTDLGVWSGMYIGLPLVFALIEVMNGCGLVGRKALGVANTTIYWMSQQQFFQMAAGGVPTPMPCSVWDRVFQRIDKTAFSKVRFFANSQHNEIGWYFPVSAAAGGGTGENTEYVKVNKDGHWDYGSIGRSAWHDESVLGPPLGGTTAGFIYQHEISPDADGVAMTPFLLTGNYAINKGQEFGFVDYMIPDAIYGYNNQPQTAQILISFLFRDFPNDTPRVAGPFPSTAAIPFIEPHNRGRLMQIKIESQDLGTWWRLSGAPRFRIAPDGRNPL